MNTNMNEAHYIHHEKPLAALVVRVDKLYNITIWNIGDCSHRELDWTDMKKHSVKFENEGVSHDSLETYLKEFQFYDSDLVDHNDPKVLFRLDLGGES